MHSHPGHAVQESKLLNEIEKRCALRGLLFHASKDSRRDTSAGWPDLVVVGPGGIIFRELKSDQGRLQVPQRRAGSLIERAGGNWAVWRPQHLTDGNISQWLTVLAADRPVK